MGDVKVKSFLGLALAAALTACGDETDAVDAVPAPAPRAPPTDVAAAAMPLTRADLIAAVSCAAGDYATGQASGETDLLVGRSFSVRLPFGCSGPAAVEGGIDGLARAAWQGEDRGGIALSLTPADWTRSALITTSGADWEAVEGFWIDRTWLLEERCPTVRADPLQMGAVFVEPPSLGLAAVHAEGASRLARREGRAYRHPVRATDGSAPTVPEQGWGVRLEGRVVSFPDGRAFRCRAPGPDARPTCVAAVSIDRVAFEAADGTVLSQWRPG